MVAASNKDLVQLLEEGSFCKDLYYRINMVKLWLHPLANGKEDIPLLAEHFIGRFNINQLQDKTIVGLSPEALAILMRHDWPGNIRALENAIEHVFILCRNGLIQPDHLSEHLRTQNNQLAPSQGLSLREIEKRIIWETLERFQWRGMATTRELGIDKNTLRQKSNATASFLQSRMSRQNNFQKGQKVGGGRDGLCFAGS